MNKFLASKFYSRLILILTIIFILSVSNLVKFAYPLKYQDFINKYSKEYNIDPYIIISIINCESRFNKDAKSNKAAYGLMQIKDTTAVWAANQMGIRDFKLSSLYDPETNIKIGCWYINSLNSEFKGNTDSILAAYNAGIGNVTKWLQDSNNSKNGKDLYYIPYKETDKYVKKVKTDYTIYKMLYSKVAN